MIRSSCLLLLASFTALSAQAQLACDTPRETKVTWTNATERVDGSPFDPATELLNTAIFMSTETCVAEELLHETMIIVEGDDNEICIGEQEPGDWCYVSRHQDIEGLLSMPSNLATKVVQERLPPGPPGDLRVDPDATAAYYLLQTTNTAILIPIGDVPAETTCSQTSVVDDNGRLAYKVPVEDILWRDNRRAELMWATCR